MGITLSLDAANNTLGLLKISLLKNELRQFKNINSTS